MPKRERPSPCLRCGAARYWYYWSNSSRRGARCPTCISAYHLARRRGQGQRTREEYQASLPSAPGPQTPREAYLHARAMAGLPLGIYPVKVDLR